MSAETRTFHRRLLFQLLCVVLALPILYAAASGPLLSFAAHRDDDELIRWQSVQRFYRPLFDVVKATSLAPPLTAYLKVWGVDIFRIRTGHAGHVLLLVLAPPDVHRRIYHGSETYPDDSLKPGR